MKAASPWLKLSTFGTKEYVTEHAARGEIKKALAGVQASSKGNTSLPTTEVATSEVEILGHSEQTSLNLAG